MENSPIQWCDDTCNPVIGCDGCELWPKNAAVAKALVDELARHFPDIPRAKLAALVKRVLQDNETADLYHYRNQYIHEIDRAVLKVLPKGATAQTVGWTYEALFKCYAARLTDMRAGHKGYSTQIEAARIAQSKAVFAQNSTYGAVAATQTTLDTLSLIPVLNIPASLGSGAISLYQGDYFGAGISFLGVIPFASDFTGPLKIGRRFANAAEDI
jgi:hypothetical protein